MLIRTSIDRFTASNGLRIVVVPDEATPVVAVSVHYDVGSRLEPEGRSGFAHLFEHLMFEGSENVPKGEHFRQVFGSGGLLNGRTTPDCTVYHNVVPAEALASVLFFEADRMRAPALTADALRNQVDVVEEEIRSKVLGVPYGGFLWRLTSVLYETFANAHDSWGNFADLETATLAECMDFFDTYYCPGNAIITVAGPVTVDLVEKLVRRYFDDIPPRAVPQRPNFDEPVPRGVRRREIVDPLAPSMKLAVGYRLPDPTTQVDEYLAYLVLADLLAEGTSSRLQRRLVYNEALASTVECGPLYGEFLTRHPATWYISADAAPAVSAEQIVDVIDAELDLLARQPPTLDEVTRSVKRRTTSTYLQYDDPVERVRGLGMSELLHGQAELLLQLPQRLAAVTPDHVAAAAAALHPDSRAILTAVPSGGTA